MKVGNLREGSVFMIVDDHHFYEDFSKKDLYINTGMTFGAAECSGRYKKIGYFATFFIPADCKVVKIGDL